MTLTEAKKNEMIEELIQNDFDVIKADMIHGDYSFLYDILSIGFKGYANYTDEELLQEYNDRNFKND
jgi:hypothetical protein